MPISIACSRGVRRIFSRGGVLKSGPKYFAPEKFKIAPAEKWGGGKRTLFFFFFFFLSQKKTTEPAEMSFSGGGGGGG